MTKRIARVLALAVLLSPVATARDIDPKKLQASVQKEVFELRQAYASNTSVARSSVSYVLLPGAYVRTFESKEGYFLVGGENSLEVRVTTPRRNEAPLVETVSRQGGIFVASEHAKGATLLFFLPGDKPPQVQDETTRSIAEATVRAAPAAANVGGALGGALVNAILRARAGKMVIPKGARPDPSLLTLLSPLNAPEQTAPGE